MKNSLVEWIKNIGASIVANIIWYAIPTVAVLLVPLINSIIVGNINVLSIICSVASAILAIIAIVIAIRKSSSRSIIGKEKDYGKEGYYFKEYKKHLTIYKNGNGIIWNSFVIHVNKKKNMRNIRRKLNIEDGKKSSIFPTLENMLNLPAAKRFDNFGFWYYSREGIVSNVKEFYWTRTNPSKENMSVKNNPKELRWIFEIDRSKISDNGDYYVEYAISVPGIVALEDGKLDISQLNDLNFAKDTSSNMAIDHRIKHLTYVVSFEQGIELLDSPVCEFYECSQDEPEIQEIEGKKEENLFYVQHTFNIENPKMASNIRVFWNFYKVEEN